MTLAAAIELADLSRPNEFDASLKRFWLSALDGQIRAELYESCGETPALGIYDGSADDETELLVPWPFDDLYVRYLVMRIDFENGEFERYNNDAAAFNRILQSYAGYYVRHHLPQGAAALRF